jgi:threonine dehydrogenase-like Zn-dependent dehydrogenase
VSDATDPVIAVLGAGTMGLAAVAGLVRYVPQARIVVGARYPHQQRVARQLGAHDVVPAAELSRAVRRIVGCHVVGDHLSSGAHATIDAVGSEGSVREALSITRPRGRVVMMGMPAEVTLDLTGLWHRETELVGAYTYGTEHLADGTTVRTFDLAMATADAIEAERWLTETYPLADHVDAIAHAAAAGRRGAVKIAFDLRSHLRREP